MVVLLGLTAAMLYGTGDFLGGLATRRAPVLMVLMLAETAGVIVALPAAFMSPGPARPDGVVWGISAGLVGGLGLIIFYVGLAPPSTRARCSALSRSCWPVRPRTATGPVAPARQCELACPSLAEPLATALPRVPCLACSSFSSAMPGSPVSCGRLRPGGSVSWQS